jgi:putative nucleotidyltransferase with HDIG domain
MGIITLQDIKPSMTLAEDLRDRNGRFLLAKGTNLTSKHLRVLKIWGVIEADIEDATQDEIDGGGSLNVDPHLLEAAEDLIRERFSHFDLNQSPNPELFRLCALRKIEKLNGSNPTCTSFSHIHPEPENIDEGQPPDGSVVQEDILSLIHDGISLSTLPIIVMQINEVIRNPSSSTRDIANVISRDTSLTARLLKIVNSAFYGYPSKIDTLSRAVLVIGTKQICTLAMGLKIISFFKSIPSELIDMGSFLRHSVACGIVARLLASHKNIHNVERLFVGGLLHDIGRLILYNHVPAQAKLNLTRARRTNQLLFKVEREAMQCDHTRVGGYLLKKWKLPVSLEDMVAYHHCPMKSKDPIESSVLHIADVVANALEMGSSGEWLVPPLDPLAWKCVGLSPNALPIVIGELDTQFEEISRFLLDD